MTNAGAPRPHDFVNDPRLAPTPTRTRPGRHIPFEPLPRLTPSVPPRWVKEEAETPSTGARFARLGVRTLLALGWLVFAAWWVIVLTRETTAALARAGGLVAAMLVTCAIVMSAWTRYNKWIARRGKRGRSSLFIPMQWERDTLGRPLAFPANDAARTASDVRIVLRNRVKAYVVADEENSL
jgi:hypothetical protein